ncbi:HLJ1_G0018760.mRNA.1.CDS.1 [Saccharomyces cerevisiae]|nr:HLJ1_G0018760.mRNA.1.CDS.1 [Saccharomyces cerevisiae]
MEISVSTSTPTPTITKTKDSSDTSTVTRRKQPIRYIENKTRRHVTFSKRRHGIMKKAYELSVLTGANILLLILANSGLVYTFTTPKLEPVVREDEDIEEGTPTNNGQQKERRKIEIKFIENKTRRHVTFSKRKHGIMKKAFELSVLTGTQVLLLVVSETGLVYTFSTPKFEPIVTQQEGRNLIQACLNAPDDEEEDEEEDGDDDDDDDDDGNDMQRQQPQQQQPQQQQQVLNAHANSLGHLNQDQVPAGALKQENAAYQQYFQEPQQGQY